jgi:hypothetical protein
MTILQFPHREREDFNEEEAVIRRWLKLADIALASDVQDDDTPSIPLPDRRAA